MCPQGLNQYFGSAGGPTQIWFESWVHDFPRVNYFISGFSSFLTGKWEQEYFCLGIVRKVCWQNAQGVLCRGSGMLNKC